MRIAAVVGVLATASFLAGPVGAARVADADLAEARRIVGAFMTDLKSRLTAAIDEQGPGHAVSVCHVEAPQIASAQEAASGWSVGRTSTRVRNRDNEPDNWERDILESFAERLASGEDPAAIEHAEIVDDGEGATLRYMKAIPTAELCLACHGAELDQELAGRIDELYPEDRARGFEVGELRGAFTLEKPLTE